MIIRIYMISIYIQEDRCNCEAVKCVIATV